MDEDEIDQSAHEKLLNIFGQGAKGEVRRELGISGDASAAGLTKNEDLSLSKLINQSSKTSKKKSLASKLSKSGADKTLKVEATTIAARAAERSVDYTAVSAQVSDWEPIIKANRQAEKLLFPLDKEPLTHFATAADITKRSAQNPTSLEQQVYATLKSAGAEIPSKMSGLTENETNLLDKLDYDEALARLKELRRHRVLTSNQLARFKREKSIKSKKFKRLKTRYKMERLKEELESKGLNTVMRDRRIQERTTLRHRVTSKWDRKLSHYAKHEKSTRDELESKRELNKKLTAKKDEVMAIDDDVDEDSEDEEEWQVVTNKRGPNLEISLNNGDDYSSGSDSEKLVDDVEPEKVIEYRKNLEDIGESTLQIGGGFKRKFGSKESQLHINPTNFLKSVPREEDIYLRTSANTSAIQEAFENDEDLIEEMEEDKPDNAMETAVDITQFGWGTWTGPGMKASQSKSKIQKPAAIENTKSYKMGYVVFTNVKNEKLAEHQLKVSDVPFAYKKPEALESSLRQPIGPDFNTAASFKSLIEPRIRKKVGVAIEPISREDEPKSSKLGL